MRFWDYVAALPNDCRPIQGKHAMQIVEEHLLAECIRALQNVLAELKDNTVEALTAKALSDKKDSLFFDVLTEKVIHSRLIEQYDEHIVLITEERGEFNYEEISDAEVVLFVDPTDRSKFLRDYMEQRASGRSRVSFGSLLETRNLIADWETFTGAPSQLSGACCAITVAKRGRILFSLVLNYITQEFFVACSDCVACHPAMHLKLRGDRIAFTHWRKVKFSKPRAQMAKTFVTYLGKSYQERLDQSNFLDPSFRSLEKEPGGPARILYLSNLNPNPVGFILANGEKIGEWIHWLSFCKWANSLVAYSIYPGIFFAKDEMLTTPSPPYSILEVKQDELRLNYDKLRYFSNPSRYREMILITHMANSGIRAWIEPKTDKCRRLRIGV